jgi:hypothetical protein
MRILLAVLACVAMAACTTTSTRLADKAEITPASGTKVLLVQPDVQLSQLTASGLQEPRAEWSQSARANLAGDLKEALNGRSHQFTELDPSTALEGRAGQLLRLHTAIGQSILAFEYGGIKLPTKKGVFDWTLGDGAQELGHAYGADYALFTYASGSWSSGGRKALFLLAAAGGIAIQMGGQSMFASLVDLKTGRIVWFNMATASSGDDMRTPEGAKRLVAALLKNAPL